MKIHASRIMTGWKHPTKFIFPDEMHLVDGRVRMLEREWLGLRRQEEVIPANRIASIRLEEGIIKASIVIETFGGDTFDLRIDSIPKSQARAFRDAIHVTVEEQGTTPQS